MEIKPTHVSRTVAQTLLDCGHTKLDFMIANGEIEAVKRGRRVLVKVDSIEKHLAALPAATIKYAKKKIVRKI
jgi:excisionase family DNA binding protein